MEKVYNTHKYAMKKLTSTSNGKIKKFSFYLQKRIQMIFNFNTYYMNMID